MSGWQDAPVIGTKMQAGTVPYQDLFEQAASKYNVPLPLLLGVAKQESNFNPRAISNVGAEGIMQLMPKYFKNVNRFDPTEAIPAAADYFAQNYKRLGSWEKAIQAYNQGPTAVAQGKPMPSETKDYVQKVAKYRHEYAGQGTAMTDSWKSAPLVGATPDVKTEHTVAQDIALGSSKGVMEGLGGPVDIVTGALNAVLPNSLQITNPIGGSKWLSQMAAKLGIGPNIDYSPTHPFASRVAQEVGAFTTNVAPLYAAARYGTSTIPLIESIRNAPQASAIRDLTTAGFAGAGASIAQQTYPSNPYAEVAGELAGGLWPALSPTKNLGHAGLRLLRNTFSRGAVKQGAAQIVQELAVQPKMAASALRSYTEAVPGEQLSAGQVTQNPGLLRLEKSLVSKQAELQADFSSMAQATNQSLRAEAESVGSKVPVQTSQELIQDRRDYLRQLMDARIAQAREGASQKLSELSPAMGRTQVSLVARKELEQALGDARAQERQLWSAVPQDVPVSTENTMEAYQTLVKSRPKTASGADIPGYVHQIFKKDILAEGSTVGEMQAYRSTLGQLIRDERGKPAPNYNKIRILTGLQDAALEDMGGGTSNVSGVNDTLTTALAYSRDLNTRFKQGIVGRILGYEKTGGQAVAPELTLESLGVGPKLAVSTDQLLSAVQVQPEETKQALQNMLMDKFMRTVAPQGALKPAAATQFLTTNEAVLNKFPELKQTIQEAVRSKAALDRISAVYGNRMTSLADARKSASALFVNANPNQAINKVLQSKTPVQNMQNLVKMASKDSSGDALKGLKAAFMDELMGRAQIQAMDETGVPYLSGRKMLGFIAQHKDAMLKSGLFTKEDFGRITKIASTATKLELARNSGTLDQVMTAAPDLLTDFVSRVVGANIGGMAGKGTGAPIVAAGAGSRLIRSFVNKIPIEKVQVILSQAIHDKNLMHELLTMPTEKEAPSLIKKIADQTIGLGVTVSEHAAEVQQNQQVQ